jgi:hypothetical protein
MKIFGEGTHVTEPEREQALDYAIHQSNIHTMTLGLESIAQARDAIDRVVRISSVQTRADR